MHHLPSHRGGRAPVSSPLLPTGRVLRRRLGYGLLIFVVSMLVVGLAGFASGAFVPVLERQAVAALERSLPDGLTVETGSKTFAFDLPASFGIAFNDVIVSDAETGENRMVAGELGVTLRVNGLMSGEADIAQLRLSDAVISLPDGGPAPSFSELNRLDHHKQVLAGGLERIKQILANAGSSVDVNVDDLSLNRGGERLARVDQARLLADQGLLISASVEPGSDGEPISLSGRAQFSADDQTRLSSAVLETSSTPLPVGGLLKAFSNDPADRTGERRADYVDTSIVASLERQNNDRLTAIVRALPEPIGFKLAVDDVLVAEAPITFGHATGDSSISIVPGAARLGRTAFELSGGVRWVSDPGDPELGYFDVEVIANDGALAPSDVQGPRLAFSASFRANIHPDTSVIDLPSMRVVTEGGVMEASGQMALAAEVPLAVAYVTSDRISTAALKQLWPAPVARGARRWVLENVAGGQVRDLVFDIAEPLRRRVEGTNRRLIGDTAISMKMEGVRFDVAGEIPPVRDAFAQLTAADGVVTVELESGRVFMENGLTADASDGVLTIKPQTEDRLIPALLSLNVAGTAEAIGQLITYPPVRAQRFYDFDPSDLSGDVTARLTMDFIINNIRANDGPDWEVDLDVANGASAVPIEGRDLSALNGKINVTRQRAEMELEGQLDRLPADLSLVIPFGQSDIVARRDVELRLGDADRARLAPGLDGILRGVTPIDVEAVDGGNRISANLTDARLTVPWLEWTKSPGIPAQAAFLLQSNGSATQIRNLSINGDSFAAAGSVDVGASGLSRINLPSVRLNRFDDFSVDLRQSGGRYQLDVSGQSFDARALIRRVRETIKSSGDGETVPIDVDVQLNRVLGFGEQVMRDVRASVTVDRVGVSAVSVTGTTQSGMPFSVALDGIGTNRRIKVEALDAGDVLRFVDLYGQVRGGVLALNLSGTSGNRLTGNVSISQFRVFDEPRLDALVSTRASDAGSLRDAVDRDINTQEVSFDLAYADLDFGPGTLDLSRGVLRGPLVGLSMDGRAFDANNQIRMNGTFMPAYGLNTVFSDIPVLGALLGNGRDRGLIGVTFQLTGDADKPDVAVNPLSVIAPGIFRSIFEFR